MRRLPLLLTLLNGVAGLTACALALLDQLTAAMVLVLVGAVLDYLDGLLARRLGVLSRWGAAADTVGDLVSFGLAPALVVFAAVGPPWGVPFGGLYLVAVTCRLVRFRQGGGPEGGFLGMPSPSAGIALSAAAVLGGPQLQELLWVGAASLLLALLAVSRIEFPRLGHPALRVLPRGFWIVLYGGHGGLFLFQPAVALLSLMGVYLVLGPALMARHRAKRSAATGAGVV